MPAEVAVIVPVHNATGTLPGTLAALERLRFDGDFEVLFVDDASTDDPAWCFSKYSYELLELGEQLGPAGARNAGVAATTAPLLAFTDADCEPEPDWLQALVAGLRDRDLVQGPVEPVTPPGRFDRTLRIAGPSPLFETANLGVRRELFERVGGFEPLAAVDDGHFGEDALFGWRAVRAGARRGWAPDAVVRHAVFPRSARGFLKERTRLRFFPHLVRLAPELRSGLHARVFLSRHTARFDLALAGLVAAALARRPLLALCALPYARGRRGSGPVYVAGDAIGLVALIRGSVGARRVVL